MDKNKIPYKIYLEEHEMPKQWYNVRADMKKKPAPLLNPETLQPMTVEELSEVFCTELAKQELDDTTAYFDIPQEILDFYKTTTFLCDRIRFVAKKACAVQLDGELYNNLDFDVKLCKGLQFYR